MNINRTLTAVGAVVFAKACARGLEGHRVETERQPLSLRQKPQLAKMKNANFLRT
jgi:hypothetical protein